MASVTDQCSIEWCDRAIRGNGYCNAHYLRDKRGGDMNKPVREIDTAGGSGVCAVEGCARGAYSKRMCATHAERVRSGRALDFPIMVRGLDPAMCEMAECDNDVVAKGLCKFHYSRLSSKRPLDAPKWGTLNLGECSVKGCLREASARGLCSTHYYRVLNGGSADTPIRAKRQSGQSATCEFPGCTKPWCSRGYCYTHYEQKYIKKIKLRPIRSYPVKICSITGCGRKGLTRTTCAMHTRRADQYGLSVMQLNAIVIHPNCDSCGAEFAESPRHIDHDHACCDIKGSCGMCIRGILCSACNIGLGAFNDSPAKLIAAVGYLDRANQAA